MGTTQTKEETIIAQAAAGDGKNSATAETSYSSATTTNLLLTVIVVLMLAAALYSACHFYKRIHENWMERQMNRRSLRRSQALGSIDRRPAPQLAQV